MTIRNVSHSHLSCSITQNFLYLIPVQFKSARKCENNENHKITMKKIHGFITTEKCKSILVKANHNTIIPNCSNNWADLDFLST